MQTVALLVLSPVSVPPTWVKYVIGFHSNTFSFAIESTKRKRSLGFNYIGSNTPECFVAFNTRDKLRKGQKNI